MMLRKKKKRRKGGENGLWGKEETSLDYALKNKKQRPEQKEEQEKTNNFPAGTRKLEKSRRRHPRKRRGGRSTREAIT